MKLMTTSWGACFTDNPLIETMMSPLARPALSAGELAAIDSTVGGFSPGGLLVVSISC